MRSPSQWILTLVLAGLAASPVVAQPAALGGAILSLFENGIDKPLLLGNDGVKRELRLTDEQSAKVVRILQEVRDKYQPELQKARGDRQQQAKVIAESTRESRERLNKALPDILSAQQMKRLDEIQIQVNGIVSFKRSDVQKKLDLSDDQKAEIRKIGDGLRQDVAELFKDAASAPLRKLPAAARKAREMKDEATQKAVAKLTSAQQKTWREMTGEKFDFHFEMPRRPGGLRP